MSPSIWTRCGGSSSFRRLACSPWRIVEGQRILSARKLVDSESEYEVLEALVNDAKPALPSGFARLDFLLFTPFRYPPLEYGSRFGGRHERSIWYGAEEPRTALAEAAFYRLLFFEGTKATLAPNTITVTAFQARIRTDAGVDLTAPPFSRHRLRIASRTSYADSQRLGSEMRQGGVEAFRYSSARSTGPGVCVGVFTASAFSSTSPLSTMQTWFCTVTPQRDVEYRREDVGAVRSFIFPRSGFLVGGLLPRPAP